MDLATLEALRSPVGVPSHPVIFLALGVLTWALHILAVHVVVGGLVLSLAGLLQRGHDHWQRLSVMLLNHAKVGVSIAIVVGVAPLLFVQVIYDPFWYVSNVLSARWAMGFIVLLLLGYYALWLHYGQVSKHGDKASPGWLVISLALILMVGFIMHVLSIQMLSPDKWMSWYAPGGHIDASGSRIHDFHLARWGFIISLALPVSAAWIMACRLYLAGREGGEDQDYLGFLAGVARRLTVLGGMLSLGLFVAWMVTLPGPQAELALSPWSAAVAATLVLLMLFTWKGPEKAGYLMPVVALVMALTLGALREVLRYAALHGGFGYDFMNYKIVMDWYSTILFIATFLIVGGIPLAFMLSLSWQAGRIKGVYSASPLIAKLGIASVAVSGVWVLHYFAVGAWVLAR